MDDLNRGIERFNAGRHEEALRCFHAAITAGRGAAQARVFIAHAYAGLAKFLLSRAPARDRAAEKALLGILTLTPSPALRDALLACGRTFRAAGALDAAEKSFARASAPEDLVSVLLQRGEEKDLRQALLLIPGHSQARRSLVLLLQRRALALVSADRLPEAAAALRRALVLAPRDAESRRRLDEISGMRAHAVRARRQKAASEARARRRRDEALVLRRFERRLPLAPSPAPRSLKLQRRLSRIAAAWGRRQLSLGRSGPGEKALRLALSLSPKDDAVRRDIAGMLRARALAPEVPNAPSRFPEAIRAWRDVLEMDPRDGAARLSLSLLLRWTGRPEEEARELRRAVEPGSALKPADRFKALMRLGRCAEATRLAERILDVGATLADLRAFWDPWEKDNRPDREAPLTDLRALDGAPAPWRQFYLGCLAGPRGLRHFDAIPGGRRYRWMHYSAAMEALFSGDFRMAVSSFNTALRHKPLDWRAHGYLAEAYACVDEPALARREMARGSAAAPRIERAQALAWRGELDLWLGDYARALVHTTRARAMGAPFAGGWRGAALLKLGRRKEALAQLDDALRLYPNDHEARLWRAEAKRELGRCLESLEDLGTVTRQHRVWILFNSALAKHALGDDAGMKADFGSLPAEVVERVRRAIGANGTRPLDSRETAQALEAGLRLARGFRRGEYAQSVWLSRSAGRA